MKSFFYSVKSEAKKVVWPTWHDTKAAVLIIVAVVLLSMVLFALIDSISYSVVRTMIGM